MLRCLLSATAIKKNEDEKRDAPNSNSLKLEQSVFSVTEFQQVHRLIENHSNSKIRFFNDRWR
jgi:hypothetical protein